ncbi:hypothetical protein RS9916_31602 [Synechococcus sp. RS9916]|nr:hypothetical protein RS9916_31602 [Synechococcus sp. RS9916]
MSCWGCADCSPLRSAQHHYIRDFPHDLTDPQGVGQSPFMAVKSPGMIGGID